MRASRVETNRDPYAILGIGRGAAASEIRAAYRALVARYHPDRHQGNPLSDLAAQRVADVNWAYETLSDPELRAAYDFQAAGGPGRVRGPGAAVPAGPAGRMHLPRPIKWLLLLLALPVLIRFGAGLARLLAMLARALFEAATSARGTPLVGVAVLALAGLLTFSIVRRRRRRRPPP